MTDTKPLPEQALLAARSFIQNGIALGHINTEMAGCQADVTEALLLIERAIDAYELGARSTARPSDDAAAQPVEPTTAMAFEVRVAGPDDVIPFTDEVAALRYANANNLIYIADRLKHPDDEVMCIATVHALPAASGDSTPPSEPACETCKGVGMIGGFVNADSGYDGMPCPECSPKGDPSGAPRAEPEAVGQDPKPATPEPAWKAEKAEIDAMDDGYGPYLEWTLQDARVGAWKKRQWERFKCWAEDFMGQGYSLACFEGAILDSTTRWTFRGYLAGVDAAQLPEPPQASGCSHTAGPDAQSKVDDQEPTAKSGSTHE